VSERFLDDEARLRERDERLAAAVAEGEPLLLEPLANGARTREEAFYAAIAAEERPFLATPRHGRPSTGSPRSWTARP
jgi:hypothetical protein